MITSDIIAIIVIESLSVAVPELNNDFTGESFCISHPLAHEAGTIIPIVSHEESKAQTRGIRDPRSPVL